MISTDPNLIGSALRGGGVGTRRHAIAGDGVGVRSLRFLLWPRELPELLALLLREPLLILLPFFVSPLRSLLFG